MSSILALGVVVFFLWAVLGHSTPAERQRGLDSSCPPHPPVIRYPAELGGPHPAVCNPTRMTWRN